MLAAVAEAVPVVTFRTHRVSVIVAVALSHFAPSFATWCSKT